MGQKYKKIKAQLGLNLDPDPKKKIPTFTPSFDQLLESIPMQHNLYGPDWDAQTAHDRARESSKLATNPLEKVERTDKLSGLQPYTPIDFTKDKESKRRKDILGDALLGLGLINSLVPDKTPTNTIIRPEVSYNPNMYGTGSQAIYDKGGKLSSSKAREMLRDGTANGKKLTKKQKRYFGMVAAGKADLGLTVDPNDPKTPSRKQLEEANMLAKQFALRRDMANAQEVNVGNTLPLVTFNGAPIPYGSPLPATQNKFKPIPRNATEFQMDAASNRAWYTDAQGDLVEMDPRDINLPQFTKNNKKTIPTNNLIAKYKKGGSLKGKAASGDMMEFTGPSHEQGGIDIAFGGKKVEVEGGETAFVGNDGDLNILGNMYVPGTKVKFKTAGKVIAKEEEKNNKLMDKGLTLIEENSDPLNASEAIKFKTGKVMMEGSKMQETNLNSKKEHLANLQQAILGSMNQGYAARGATLEDDPKKKKSMAVRMNNPGNIKFGKWAKEHGAVQGDPATDGGYFAKFPDTATGLTALKSLLKTNNYKDLSVDAAIKRWTNNSGYAVDYKDIANKKINELDPKQFDKLVNTITFGEDSKYYSPDIQTPPGTTTKKDVPVPPFDPFRLTDTPKNREADPRRDPNNPEYVPINYNIQQRDPKNPAPYQSRLDARQLSGEIYSLATNRLEPVPMQKFTPELESPYSVSFQDRLNANQATFNAVQKASGSNPEALSVLAGQRYAADNNVLGEEFRTNQQIFNEITNRNLTKLDDAELKNLGIADQQMVRQSTARSKTKAQTQLTLQSIGDKTVKNRYENLDSAFKQMMFKYRPVDKDNDGVFETLEYQGDAPQFTPIGGGQSYDQQFIRERKEYDANGNIRKTQTTEPSDMEKTQIRSKALKAYWDISVNQYNNLFKRSR